MLLKEEKRFQYFPPKKDNLLSSPGKYLPAVKNPVYLLA
jgi:hypothetical protein